MIKSLEELKNKIATPYDGIDDLNAYQAPLLDLKNEADKCIVYGNLENYADCLLRLLESYGKRFPGSSTNFLLFSAEHQLKILNARR